MDSSAHCTSQETQRRSQNLPVRTQPSMLPVFEADGVAKRKDL